MTPLPNGSVSATAEQRAWYLYDWANSAFATTVVTTFLGPYLTSIAKSAADADGFVRLGAIPFDARSVWGYTVAASVAAQVLVLPALGAYADFGRRKRELLGLLAYTGALATVLLFFVTGGRWLLGSALFVFANVCFGGANVVYNSFLPEIAAEPDRDRVSSRGWGIGYLGGGLALALNLVLYLKSEWFGLTGGQAVRYSLAFAGLWWAGFASIPVARLRNRRPAREIPPGENLLSVSWKQLRHTVAEIRRYPETLRFLLAYLLYNDAVQAVITLSSQFGSDELKMTTANLTLAILMVQFVAFGGAMTFQQVAERIGAKRALLAALLIWTGVLIYIHSGVKTGGDFFIAAAIVAVVMGGTQALSRSLFSKMIPRGREAEYFGLYEISDKGTSWLAPLTFGLALQFTGSYRTAILSLIAFFLLGLAVLSRVDVEKASSEAQR